MKPTATDIFSGTGIEVDILSDDNFLKIKETLTRIGVSTSESQHKTLYQSCHILHKTDFVTGFSRYSILHFKELFKLDGRSSTFDETDQLRRDIVVNLLEQWGLIRPLTETSELSKTKKVSLTIVPHKDKANWKLVSKYTIGGTSHGNR